MSLIQTPWTSQPQQAVGIDWSNPITRGLVAAYPLGNMVSDAAKNYNPLTRVGGLATSPSAVGVTSSFNGTDAGIDLPSSDIVSGYPITVAMWVDWVSTSTNGQVFISLQGTNYHLIIAQKQAGDGALQFGTTAAGGALAYFGVSTVNAGWRHIIHTVYGPGSFEVFIDGKRATLTNTGGNYGEPAAGNSAIGYRKAGASMRWTHTRIGQTLVYNRAFSDAEAFSLYQTPWQIFRPLPRRIFVPVAAGGGTTAVTADHNASYTITGSVAADASAAYAIRAAVTADATASYTLRAAAQADQAAAYAIRAAVASDLASSYAIQTAGTVSTGLDAAYAVRGVVAGDISVGYQIAAAVQAEVAAAYAIRAAVQKDFAAGYAIDAGVSSVAATLSAAYWIDGEAVILTPDAKFIARGAARNKTVTAATTAPRNKTVTAAARRHQIATRSS